MDKPKALDVSKINRDSKLSVDPNKLIKAYDQGKSTPDTRVSRLAGNTGKVSQDTKKTEVQGYLDDVDKQLEHLEGLAKEKAEEGFLSNVGNTIGAILTIGGASLEEALSSLDLGDHRIGYEPVDNILKAIDNSFLGDGEDTYGNWLTRRAATAKAIAGTEYGIYSDDGTPNNFMNITNNVLGSILGFAAGGGFIGKGLQFATGAIKVNKLRNAINTIGSAWLMTMGSGNAIAQGVHDQVLEKVISDDPTAKAYLDQVENEAMEDALSNGASFAKAHVQAQQARKNAVSEIQSQNPELYKRAQARAVKSAELTTQTNGLAFLLNIGTGMLFTNANAATRNIVNEPSVKRTLGTIVGEGVQEAVEEGIIEQFAEKRGLAYGLEGKDYGISDFANELTTKEGFKDFALNAGIGFIAGGGMAGMGIALNQGENKRQYEEQQKALDYIKELSGNDVESFMTNSAIFSAQIQEKMRQAKDLQDQGDSEGAKSAIDSILPVQAEFAFKTGTTDQLLEVYQKMASDPDADEEVKIKASLAIGSIKKLEKSYLNVQRSKLLNKDEVYRNRAYKDILSNEEKVAKETMVAAKAEINEEIDGLVGRGIIGKERGEELKLKIDDPSSENILSRTNSYTNYIMAKDHIDIVNHHKGQLDEQYKNMTSKATQRKLKEEEGLVKQFFEYYRNGEFEKAEALIGDVKYDKSGIAGKALDKSIYSKTRKTLSKFLDDNRSAQTRARAEQNVDAIRRVIKAEEAEEEVDPNEIYLEDADDSSGAFSDWGIELQDQPPLDSPFPSGLSEIERRSFEQQAGLIDDLTNEDSEGLFLDPELKGPSKLDGKIGGLINSLSDNNPDDLNFDGFVNNILDRSRDRAKTQAWLSKNFDNVVKSWNGVSPNKITDAQMNNARNVLFPNVQELIDDLIGLEPSVTNEDAQDQIDATLKQAARVEDVSTESSTEYTEQAEAAFPAMAFLHRKVQTKLIAEKDENGNIKESVYRDYQEAEFYDSAIINNDYSLVPGNLRVGKKFGVRLAPDFGNVPITRRDAKGIPINQVRFGQSGLKEGTQDYTDEVPMVIYDLETDQNIGFVHNVSWYRQPDRLNMVGLASVIDKTRNIRSQVLAGNNVNIKVVDNHKGTFSPGVSPNGETITVGEANPDARIGVIDKFGNFITSEGILNKNDIKSNEALDATERGSTYDFRIWDYREDGSPIYERLRTFNLQINEQMKESVLKATEIFAYLKNPNTPADKRAELERLNKVMRTKGYDFTDIQSYQKYCNQYIRFIKNAFAKGNTIPEQISAIRNENSRPNVDSQTGEIYHTPYVYTSSGSLIIVAPKSLRPGDDPMNKAIRLHPEKQSIEQIDKFMNQMSRLINDTTHNIRFNFNNDRKHVQDNKPVVYLTADNQITDGPASYKELMQQELRTTVKSKPVKKPDGTTFYATRFQPIVNFELDSVSKIETVVNEETKQPEVVKREVVVPTNDETIISSGSRNQAIARLKELTGFLGNDAGLLLDPYILSPTDVALMGENITRIEGLNPSIQDAVVNHLFNKISMLKGERLDVEKVKGILEQEMTKRRDVILELIRLAGDHPVTAKGRKLINSIDKVTENSAIILEETNRLLKNYDNVSLGTQFDDSFNVDEEHDFNADSVEYNPKDKISHQLKRMMRNVPRRYVTPEGEVKMKETYFALPEYVPFKEVHDYMKDILADTPMDIEYQMQVLKDHTDALPWISDVIDKLKNSSNELKYQFFSAIPSHALTMEFVKYDKETKEVNGIPVTTTSVRVLNDNAFSSRVKLIRKWRDNLKNKNLVDTVEGSNYALKPDVASKFLNKYWELSAKKAKVNDVSKFVKGIETGSVNLNRARSYFFVHNGKAYIAKPDGGSMKVEPFRLTAMNRLRYDNSELNEAAVEFKALTDSIGLDLHINAVKELLDIRRGLRYGKNKLTLDDLLLPSGASGQSSTPFGILVGRDLPALADPNTSVEDRIRLTNGLFRDNPFKKLAVIERKYNTSPITSSMRVGSKTVYNYTNASYALEHMNDLHNPKSKMLGMLKALPFSKNSLWLEMLSSDIPNINEMLKPIHSSLDMLRINKGRNKAKNRFTDINNIDREITKMGLYAKGRLSAVMKSFNTLDIRKVKMLFPTLSDKSKMLHMDVPCVSLDKIHVNLNNKGIDSLHADVLKVTKEQLIYPELQRIYAERKNTIPRDVKGYDDGKYQFFFLPELNTADMAGGNVFAYIREQIADGKTLEQIKTKLDPVFDQVLTSHIKQLTENTFEQWKNFGLIKESLDTEGKRQLVFSHLDNKLVNLFGNNRDGAIRLIAEYEINSLITNANSHMVLSGDPALYYKSKVDRNKRFKGIPTREGKQLAYTKEEFIEESKDTFENTSKRLALLIAPRQRIADADNNTYLQIMAKDKDLISSAVSKIKTLSGEDVAKDYSEIESTDAQELTTWNEHLFVLERMGRISDELTGITSDEIAEARTLFANGTPLDEMTDRQKELVMKVAQPIKPVYAGPHMEGGIMRMMYIKTSSFPLLPQLTAGLELDKLRVKMENLEKTNGTTVRLSYQSGNKVGATNNPVKIFKDDGTIDDAADLSSAAIQLERKYFGIQQNVPFKSAKSKKDMITMSSQMVKLLFGDGVLSLSNFKVGDLKLSEADKEALGISGDKLTAKQLENIFTETFREMTEINKSELLNSLDINPETLTPKDQASFMEKLKKMLKDEAENRDFTQADIEGLNTEEVNSITRFIMPLWTLPNGDRFESLMNSIVSKRLAQIKLPGYSLVTGSKEGFKFKTEATLDEKLKSRIVYTNKFEGELTYTERTNKGLKKAQVLMPSKFRDNDGNLIDLTSDKYSTVVDGRRMLKEGAISEDLLSNFTFRIPGSAHVSGAEVEVVGFLPPESGDLIVVPGEFTVQKGLDFDVDKEQIYILNHKVVGNKIVPIEDTANADRKEILQNRIIRIHEMVFSHNTPAMQGKIIKSLNTDFISEQVPLFNTQSTGFYSPLSQTTQAEVMSIGVDGKAGTGVYSLGVVNNSLFQQLKAKGIPLKLKNGAEPVLYIVGDQSSDGTLGKIKTIDGSRSIADVYSEAQNMAVDNQKLQIMGRVNLNPITFNAHKAMMYMGFDKITVDNVDYSVPLLLMNQPLVKEYVNTVKASKSATNSTPQRAITAQFRAKYRLGEYHKGNYKLNADALVAGTQGTIDAYTQREALAMFLDLSSQGDKLNKIETAINVDSKGLGKNYYIAKERLDNIAELPYIDIDNSEKVVGNYNNTDTIDGRLVTDGTNIQPTTIQGIISLTALQVNNALWSDFVPTNNVYYTNVLETIMDTRIDSTSKADKLKHIQNEYKKYVFSNAAPSSIFRNTDLAEERESLFFDNGDNQSLAAYLSANVPLNNILKTNRLVGKTLEYNVEINGEPSTITFNNAAKDVFDDQYLGSALTDLIIANKELPPRNSKPYNTRLLAQDLITYSILEGGVQQATQFIKFIPVKYLKLTGFGDTIYDGVNVENFPLEYFRHNPDLAPSMNIKKYPIEEGKFDSYFLDNSYIADNEYIPDFFRVTKDGIDYIYALEEPIIGEYSRHLALGTTNFNEYGSGGRLSLVRSNNKEEAFTTPTIEFTSGLENVRIKMGGTIDEMLDSVINSGVDYYARLARVLKPYADRNTKIVLSNRNTYDEDSNTITYDVTRFNQSTVEEQARMLLHEYIHSITAREFSKYYDTKYDSATGAMSYRAKTTDIPKHVSDLHKVYKEIENSLGEELIEFRKTFYEDRFAAMDKEAVEKYYGGTMVQEFMSEILTRPEFIESLSDGKVNLRQKLLDTIKRMLQNLGIQFDSLADAGYEATMQFIRYEGRTRRSANQKPNHPTPDQMLAALDRDNLGDGGKGIQDYYDEIRRDEESDKKDDIDKDC